MYVLYIYIHIIRVLPSAVALLIEIFTDALLLTMNEALAEPCGRTAPFPWLSWGNIKHGWKNPDQWRFRSLGKSFMACCPLLRLSATSGYTQVCVRIPWFLHHGFYPKIAPPSSAKAQHQLIKRRNPANIRWNSWHQASSASFLASILWCLLLKNPEFALQLRKRHETNKNSPSFSGERLPFFVGMASSMWFQQ